MGIKSEFRLLVCSKAEAVNCTRTPSKKVISKHASTQAFHKQSDEIDKHPSSEYLRLSFALPEPQTSRDTR